MIDHVLPRMACSCAIFAIAMAHCGCQSMSGPSGLASAWSSKPRQSNPNDRETSRYMGSKKDKPKGVDSDELKGQFARGAQDRQSTFESSLRSGNVALRDNRLDDARRDFEKALTVRPNDPDCHHRLAVVADKMRQFGVADDHYEAAIKKLPNDPNLLSDLGYSYFLRGGDDRRAEATLNDALKISPAHKGAMGNLGALYAKQGRTESALEMFQRNGVPEVEAQHYMAQLFPQRAGTPGTDALAKSETNNARSSSPNREEQPDYKNMTLQQVKELANRTAAEEKAKRNQALFAEAAPRRGDWTSDQRQTGQAQQQNQPLVLGPRGSNQASNSNPNHLPVVTPNGGNPLNQGYSNNTNGPGQGADPFGQASAEGPLRAEPGTNPNIGLWGDAPIQQAGGAQFNPNGQRSDVVNVPYQRPQNGTPAQQIYLPNQQRQRSLSAVPGQQSGLGPANPEFNANMAAAQMGMNVGPGALFPVMPGDPNAQGGIGAQGQPPTDSGFGNEFQSPSQFQNSGGQYHPNRGAIAPHGREQPLIDKFGTPALPPGDPRQGSFNSRQRGSFANYNDGDPLAPPSPGSNWPVAQAGAMSPTDSSVPTFSDPLDRSASQPGSAWADKPSLGGASPFTGSWPPGSQSANDATGNSRTTDGTRTTDGALQNSLPMWNGGQSGTSTRPQPRSFGPAASNQQSYVPEQWPGSAPR